MTVSFFPQNGDTPLHKAATTGQEAVLKARVVAKTDVHAEDAVSVAGGLLRGWGWEMGCFRCFLTWGC